MDLAVDRRDVELVTLEGDGANLYLTLAHRWMQDRPRMYSASGGYSLLTAYLDKAKREDQKNVGVFVGSEMVSLVTVEKEPDGVYAMHVTSPRASDAALIASAAYTIGGQLFEKLNAERVYALVSLWPVKRLCESCGLRRTGYTQVDRWGELRMEYAMTRQEWYGRQEN